ncbi:type I-F CRISPR-associated helicase Cas3f [Aliivibrio fischeri]|uniref:type I-F CRISPR-associated helicase Cas3f n=1 Tax=Aliivibrio fischeri TaxID=668 RepID=UPI00084C5D01|nr:type I-F CRISPR-associated helicase Cas3f [Aliivibrio fischeri]OED53253.1 type I-F CRISPR-associated helicase Cas3 [Aliivibrio fischeri]
MMVTFVSQCEKNALKKTRRVLDAFANRIGDNTWQTIITEDGLLTVKKMLRQTASKSTAVSCHWIRSRSRSQFLWVVGNRLKFNTEGVVPVNRTSLNLDHKEWENGWDKLEVIANATSIAGLFHDFGKANDLFQAKLKGTSGAKGEPYRHEWISLRLFEAFVKGKSDQEWLGELSEIDRSENANNTESYVLNNLHHDNGANSPSPFKSLTPLASLVAWLIVSHHRLPLPQTKRTQNVVNENMKNWLTSVFNCDWNSSNAEQLEYIDREMVNQNWAFSQGTPFISKTWQKQASKVAYRALKNTKLNHDQEWLKQRFVAHLSRLSLMLSDHYYSSLEAERSQLEWRDNDYLPKANTDRKATQLEGRAVFKQQLDEHNIGVAHNAMHFALNLPALKYALPAIGQHKLFSRNAPKKFVWQDKAYKAAKEYARLSEKQGFFGINMASTGCGKTIANARIMYALADEREGCRFSVAVGLRTLTLQTGDSYRDLLQLGDDELAVLIGSQAVKALHQINKDPSKEKQSSGSESSDDFFEQLFISYDGQIYDGRLKHWLKGNLKLEQLLSAPIVVSTIDHLMPATESLRGGKQIAPMLRLLTSDLILDEPDDFGLEDLPALCRLVNWAGMLGSRVLLSSATLPPSLINALYHAYLAGRKHFNEANFPEGDLQSVVCGWFDENKSHATEIKSPDAFTEENEIFVQKRIKKLNENKKVLRKGGLVPVHLDDELSDKKDESHIYQSVAAIIHEQIHKLHDSHHVKHSSGRKVSCGVVRMANIDPMIKVMKCLSEMSPQEDYSIHFCVYHSQFPLAVRSHKENRLDNTLTRYDSEQLWQQPEIIDALNKTTTANNIFVVVGTSVVEVGRDHDYDWGIAEPSSLRALIQLAGRIQRHRQQEPSSSNLMVLNKNIRALRGDTTAYCKPGFESKDLPLSTHDLNELLNGELESISAISRIKEPSFSQKDFCLDKTSKNKKAKGIDSFSVQEHRALKLTLGLENKLNKDVFFQKDDEACLWWSRDNHADWNGEFINQTRFRKSDLQEEFILCKTDEWGDLGWHQKDTTQKKWVFTPQNHRVVTQSIELSEGNYWWMNTDAETIYSNLAEQLEQTVEITGQYFGAISLRAAKEDQELIWNWHDQLGIYQTKITRNNNG